MIGLRKLGLLLLVSVAVLASAAAQDTQRFETFGGYSLLHDNHMLPYVSGGASSFNGWTSSNTVFLNRWLGVTSEFSGNYGSTIFVIPPPPGGTPGKRKYTNNSYTFLFGPHFVYHRSRYAPFAQALFGVLHELTPTTDLVPVTCPPPEVCNGTVTGARTSDTNFAMALGGGLDVRIGHGISIRPVEAEYLLRRYSALVPNGGTQLVNYATYFNGFRFSTGITFRFGEHLGGNK